MIMYTTISQYSKYAIAQDGTVLHLESNTIVSPTRDDGGRLRVTLIVYGKQIVNPQVARLVLMVFNPLEDIDFYSNAFVAYKDGNLENVSLLNLEWSFETYKPKFIPGVNCRPDRFITIPGYSDFEINSLGIVQHKREGIINPINSNEYLRVIIYDSKGIRRTVGLHRLLALTFLEHPIDTKHLVINHKDGNTQNNALWNIEWCTYSHNLYHAYTTGLRDGCDRILAMNVETRDIHEFYSLNECGRYFKRSAAAIFSNLHKNKTLRPYHGHFVKYADDDREWPELNTVFKRKPIEGFPILVKNIETDEIKRFASMSELSRKFNCTASSILLQLSYDVPKPYKGYLIRYETENIKWPEYNNEELYRMSIMSNIGTPIRVTLPNGEQHDYAGVGPCSKELKMDNRSIYKAMENSTDHRGYRFAYL
jgi:HNH endonuclease